MKVKKNVEILLRLVTGNVINKISEWKKYFTEFFRNIGCKFIDINWNILDKLQYFTP